MTENVRVGIVASSVTDDLQAGMIFEKMKRVVEKFLHKPLYDYGFIPDDGEIVQTVKKRHIPSEQSSSKAFASVTDISRTLIESGVGGLRAPGKGNNTRGFAEKLFIPPRS